MFDINTLAYNIRRYRKACGMTQQALAAALSISPQSVSKWECGSAAPDVEKLCMLSSVLGVGTERLLGTGSGERAMIAVDGGGTKTEFVLFSESGRVLGRIKKDGCNPNVSGLEGSIDVLKSGINALLRENTNVVGAFVGSAGFATGDYKHVISRELKKSYPKLKIRCETDIWNVIAAATDEESCIAAICGTGMVVYANEQGELHRIGGWGYLLDEGGSGFTIGRDCLRAALAERDGIGEHTALTEMCEERIGCRMWEHISEIYKGGNSYIASFAPIVSRAAEMGDRVAMRILGDNADAMLGAIKCAAERYDCGKTLIMVGSVISKDKMYREMIEEKLPDGFRLLVSEKPPVYGACVECAKLCGVDKRELETNFDETYAMFQ